MPRPDDLQISPRKPEFELLQGMQQQRYWLANDPVLTHFFNALQATFPEGERFFIDSAREVRDDIGEENLPEHLANDIKAFIHQEAWHGKAHDEWNQVLIDLGYKRMEEFDAQQKRLRRWANENISPMMRLAITAGAEHMTASLARMMLEKRSDLIDQAAEPVRSLLAWHALEEIEHKSVCFDLFQVAGGGYRLRMLGLVFAFLDTLRLARSRHKYLLKQDGLWNWRTRMQMYSKVWGPRGIIGQMVPELLRYVKPGFHPWQTDEREAFEARWDTLISDLSKKTA